VCVCVCVCVCARVRVPASFASSSSSSSSSLSSRDQALTHDTTLVHENRASAFTRESSPVFFLFFFVVCLFVARLYALVFSCVSFCLFVACLYACVFPGLKLRVRG
jgi:hypothetical protein